MIGRRIIQQKPLEIEWDSEHFVVWVSTESASACPGASWGTLANPYLFGIYVDGLPYMSRSHVPADDMSLYAETFEVADMMGNVLSRRNFPSGCRQRNSQVR